MSGWEDFPDQRNILIYKTEAGLKKLTKQISTAFCFNWIIQTYPNSALDIDNVCDFSNLANSRYVAANTGWATYSGGRLCNIANLNESIGNSSDLSHSMIGKKNEVKCISISETEYGRLGADATPTSITYTKTKTLNNFPYASSNTNATGGTFSLNMKNIKMFKYDDTTGDSSSSLHAGIATLKYPITYYNGVPLFAATENGEVVIENLSLSDQNVRIAFNVGPFDNEDALGNLKLQSAVGSFTENTSGGKFYYTLGTNTALHNLKFTGLSKDDVVYVKLYNTNHTTVSEFVTMDVSGDIVLTAEN